MEQLSVQAAGAALAAPWSMPAAGKMNELRLVAVNLSPRADACLPLCSQLIEYLSIRWGRLLPQKPHPPSFTPPTPPLSLSLSLSLSLAPPSACMHVR